MTEESDLAPGGQEAEGEKEKEGKGPGQDKPFQSMPLPLLTNFLQLGPMSQWSIWLSTYRLVHWWGENHHDPNHFSKATPLHITALGTRETLGYVQDPNYNTEEGKLCLKNL